jgi:hypothetical protein
LVKKQLHQRSLKRNNGLRVNRSACVTWKRENNPIRLDYPLSGCEHLRRAELAALDTGFSKAAVQR